MDDRRPGEQPATEALPPVAAEAPSAPSAAPVPQAGWGQPQAPTAGWPQPAPPAPPSAWTGPQAPPPQPWAPGAGMPTGAVYVRSGTTALAKIGALFLTITAMLLGLLGALIVLLGNAFGDQLAQFGLEAAAVGAVITFFGVVLLVIAVVQLLTGIFSWRGAGVARVLGVIFGLLLGLLFLASVTTATRSAASETTAGGPLAWVLAIGYLYTAVVFVFAYRQKR